MVRVTRVLGFTARAGFDTPLITTKKKEKKRDQDAETDAESKEEDLQKWLGSGQ
jgi:hypothetical protein